MSPDANAADPKPPRPEDEPAGKPDAGSMEDAQKEAAEEREEEGGYQ